MTYETVKGLHCAAAFRRLQVGVDDDAEESLLPGPGASGRSGYTEFGAVITGARAGAYQDIGGYTGGQDIGSYQEPRARQYRSEETQAPFSQSPQVSRSPFSRGQESLPPVHGADQVMPPFSVHNTEPPASQSLGSEGSSYQELIRY